MDIRLIFLNHFWCVKCSKRRISVDHPAIGCAGCVRRKADPVFCRKAEELVVWGAKKNLVACARNDRTVNGHT